MSGAQGYSTGASHRRTIEAHGKHPTEVPMATTSTGFDAVERYLAEHDVNHQVVEHDVRPTAAADARAAGVEPDDAAKTVVLRDGAGYRLVVIPASCHLDMRKLRELIGAGHEVRLATEHEIADGFGGSFEVGALPPFGPLLDDAPEIVDRRLLDHDRVMCSGGDHRHGLMLDPREILRVCDPQVADVCLD
jgi:Ala-tRNA(Pro) deacylase